MAGGDAPLGELLKELRALRVEVSRLADELKAMRAAAPPPQPVERKDAATVIGEALGPHAAKLAERKLVEWLNGLKEA